MILLSKEGNKIVIMGEIEDFRPLIDSKDIPQNLLESGGSFLSKSEIIFRIITDAEKLINSIVDDDLVTKYRNLFPEGYSNVYDKPFRGNLKKCIDNLKKFKKEFKYSDEVILAATKSMIERQTRRGKKDWIPQAHYFIYHRDKGSELATECENLNNAGTSEQFSKWK